MATILCSGAAAGEIASRPADGMPTQTSGIEGGAVESYAALDRLLATL